MRLFLIFFTIVLVVTSRGETTETNEHEIVTEKTLSSNTTVPPILDATASKLVRYRSKPPVHYYRFKPQPNKRPRPRIKMPPIKYGPPIYNAHKPSSYRIKPDSYASTQSYKPSYSYDEVHYDVNPEYPVIENHGNYESQSIDLDLYSDSYSKKKAPQYEYSKPRKPFSVQRPHKVYGVPKESSYTSYDTYHAPKLSSKPEVHYEVSYHEESPKGSYGPPPSQKEEYEQFPPYGPPPTQISYHVPDKYEGSVDSYHPPPKEVSYSVYNKKLPNAGYTYKNHFAEPPTDFHFTYSPSYEIKTLPPKHYQPQNTYEEHPPIQDSYGPPSDSYNPPTDTYESFGDSYSAPDYNQHSHSEYQPPSGGHFAEPPESYLPPAHQPEDLPLNKNHMPPGYDYPKSSYEVPIYDPIPFESTTADQDYFPPYHNNRSPYNEQTSESNNHIQHAPPQARPTSLDPPDEATSSSTTSHESIDATSNKVLRRYTPYKIRPNRYTRLESTSKVTPITEDTEAPSPKYLDKILSTTSTYRPRRKRKRTKAPISDKHNLDVPELQQAFDSGQTHPAEPSAHESNVNENVDKGRHPIQTTPPVRTLTNFTPSQSWNPIRIRTKIPNTQRGQRVADEALSELKNIEVLSIEKSRSHSYYAGTVAPRVRDSITRSDKSRTTTMSSTTYRTEEDVQPTRNLVIDTTYFKVKEDEKDFYDGTGELPKNHKLF